MDLTLDLSSRDILIKYLLRSCDNSRANAVFRFGEPDFVKSQQATAIAVQGTLMGEQPFEVVRQSGGSVSLSPTEPLLLWNYLQPKVVDFVSVLRDLGNPMVVCPVATDSFVLTTNILPGDLVVSNAMSCSLRKRQAQVKSCWCAMGWRHGVSDFFWSEVLECSRQDGDIFEVKEPAADTGDSCFVSFRVEGIPNNVNVLSNITASIEAATKDFYGCVEVHNVFGERHTGVAVLCTIPLQGLQTFQRTLKLNLNARKLVFDSMHIEVLPAGVTPKQVEKWHSQKTLFLEASHGGIIKSSRRFEFKWRMFLEKWCSKGLRARRRWISMESD